MNNHLKTDHTLDRNNSEEVIWIPVPKKFLTGEMLALVNSHAGKEEEIFSIYIEQGQECFGFTLGEVEIKRFDAQRAMEVADRAANELALLGQVLHSIWRTGGVARGAGRGVRRRMK